MVICLERGADLRMAQLMPLPLTVSCFSKIQIGLPFWYQLTRVVLDKGPLNVCVCVCVCVCPRPLVLNTGKWMVHEYFTNSWGYGAISIFRAWIHRLIPLFSGRWGNCPKFHQKLDSALICQFVITKRRTV